ncbi:hypothetical protein EOA19_30735 [Mesorhizobium sp. M7A.F.Ca.US.010.02.1.1]|nr:hypothetical protein EOA19_30735 [Mesorhizobium sp. M7A.F.Ca.US.010.02.1.1]
MGCPLFASATGTRRDGDRQGAPLPLTADDALPETGEIAGTDLLEVEALAAGLSGDEARALIGWAVTPN